MKFAPKNIAFLGISFKEGTDDLRFSPNLKLAQRLFSENINIKVHDQNVFATIQDGINDLEVRNSAGSIYSKISDNLDSVIENADLIIIAAKNPLYSKVIERTDIPILDLVRIDNSKVSEGNYHGICW